MNVTLVFMTAVSFVIQVVLLIYKFDKQRWRDLMWDVPFSGLSIYLGVVGGATVMVSMLIASNLLSITLLIINGSPVNVNTDKIKAAARGAKKGMMS